MRLLLSILIAIVLGVSAHGAAGSQEPPPYALVSSNATVTFVTNTLQHILDLSVATSGGATNGIQQLNGFGTNTTFNGATVHNGAHVDTNYVGQLITTNGPQVNILAFGADPTFTADSHDAIQAALDSIAVTNSMGIGTGGTVLVPPGKFLVSTNLLIPKGVRLVGTSIGFANWNSGSQLIFTNTGPAISVSINSELANLNIWGVSNAPVAGSWGICGTNSAARYRVQNCRLQYFDDGIHLDDTFIATFQDVIVNYCTNAVHTTNNSVNAISFQGMQSNFEVNNVGFLLETAGAGLSTGFTIDSVVIEGNNAGILCTGNIADLTIRSVYFEGNGAYDITINNSSMEGALITGNVLNGTGTNIVLTAARGPIIFANNFETQNVGTPKALLIASGVRDAYVGRNYYRLLPAAFTPSTDDAGNGTQVDERGINLLNRSTAIASDSILQERTANGNYKAGLDWTAAFISSSPFGGIYGYPSTYGPGASNVFSELVNTNQTLVWAGATGTPQLKIGTVGAGRLSWYWNSQEQALIDVNGINLKCPLLITPAPVLPQDAIATYKIFSGFFKGGFDMVSTFVSASNPMGGFYGYPSAYTNGTGLSVFGHAIATNMVASWSTASGNTEFQYGSAGTGAVRGYWDSIEKTRIDNSGVSVLAPLIVTGATTTDSGTATNSWSVGSLNQGSTKILTAGQHLTNIVDVGSGSGVALSLSGTNVSVIGGLSADTVDATNGIKSAGTSYIGFGSGAINLTGRLAVTHITNVADLASTTAIAVSLSGTNVSAIGALAAPIVTATNQLHLPYVTASKVLIANAQNDATNAVLTTGTIPVASTSGISDGPMQVGAVTNVAFNGGITTDNIHATNGVTSGGFVLKQVSLTQGVSPLADSTNQVLDFSQGMYQIWALTNDVCFTNFTGSASAATIKFRPNGADRNVLIDTNWMPVNVQGGTLNGSHYQFVVTNGTTFSVLSAWASGANATNVAAVWANF